MAFDPGHSIAHDEASGAHVEQPPHMLFRPAEPPPPLGHVSNTEPIQNFRNQFSVLKHQRAMPRLGSVRATVRAWAGRVSGRSDRRLLFALASATDVFATQLDTVIDRLSSQEALTSDLTKAFGEEIAHLRAEVIHMRTLASSLERGRSG